MAIRSAMCLSEGSGRITRRNVIEDSADAFPCMLRARNEVRNMRATAKQRGFEQRIRQISARLSCS